MRYAILMNGTVRNLKQLKHGVIVMDSFRQQDMRAEAELGKFMDENFYSRLKGKNGTPLKFERVVNVNTQKKGVDVIISSPDRSMLIDEKASFYYSNLMIPTFAFEIDSIQKGHDKPIAGWFINDELLTQYYMLIWPNVKCEKEKNGDKWIRKNLNMIKKEDFTIVEAMLIDKSDIRQKLDEEGFSKEYLIEYAKLIRKGAVLNEKEKDPFKNTERSLAKSIKVIYSGQLAEKPINLVIAKSLLKKVAKGIYLISSDGYAAIE